MMIPIILALSLLMGMDGMQIQSRGSQTQLYKQEPMYPKHYDGSVEYNSHQDINTKQSLLLRTENQLNTLGRTKRSTSFGHQQPQDTTVTSSESSTNFSVHSPVKNLYVNSLLKSYAGKRNRRENLKNDNPNNERVNLDSTDSLDKLENSSYNPLEEDLFIQTTSSLQFFWNANDTKKNIREDQARIMMKYMDTSVEPCDDFYKYACGNWGQYHAIPKDELSTGTFAILRYNLDVALRELLETKTSNTVKNPKTEVDQETQMESLNQTPSLGQILRRHERDTIINKTIQNSFCSNHTSEDHNSSEHCNHTQQFTKASSFIAHSIQPGEDVNSNDAERKARIYYESCTNMTGRNQRGIQPLLDVADSLGGWPVLKENWSSENFDWLNLTAHIRRYENGILIYQLVESDLKNSNRNIIQFGQTSLGLPTREYYLHDENAKYLNAYQRFMSGVMHQMGASKVKSTKTAADLIRFETQLASIATDPDNNWMTDTKGYKLMTLSDLRALIPEIDWIRYLNVLQQKSVNDSEHVALHAAEYMRGLVNLLNRTDPEIVANYLFWRFAKRRINNLDERFDGVKQSYYRELYGREENPSPWKFCISEINAGMSMALGSMFVRKYFDDNSKQDILKMTRAVKLAFRENIKTIDWLDPETKHLAEIKVDAMSLQIGYPDFILNSDKLNAEYSDIKIYPDQYFENTLNVLLHRTRKNQNKLYEPVDKTTWRMAPATVNGWHSPQQNQMLFPAGILQPPFYHRHYPRALKFGGIGIIIGHEVTHGFDNNGRLFDHNGSINDWWTNSSIKGFEERARCIIEQYGNYTVEEVGNAVNGEKTQGENIADNGGIKLAFKAYKKWLLDNPEAVLDDQLPGINLTGEQLFFLSFAQKLCSTIRNEAASSALTTDSHTPVRFRAIGSISNSEDFSKSFNCPLGSAMNPTHKCSLW